MGILPMKHGRGARATLFLLAALRTENARPSETPGVGISLPSEKTEPRRASRGPSGFFSPAPWLCASFGGRSRPAAQVVGPPRLLLPAGRFPAWRQAGRGRPASARITRSVRSHGAIHRQIGSAAPGVLPRSAWLRSPHSAFPIPHSRSPQERLA